MASTARPRIKGNHSPKPKKAPVSREQEILKDFEAFFDHHIGAMNPSQLQQFEERSAKILKESRSRTIEVVSTREKGQSSLKVLSR
jgi:flagellar hook-basal body complex protein FliE